MSIHPGTRLGPYEILAPLGAGGWVRSTEPGTPSYVQQQSGLQIRVFRVDPATGRREVWKDIGPADATGVWPPDSVLVTPDGSAYVYTFARRLTDLYEVEGLK